jgi:transcriptional regulator with XRE-family HTH domain
VQKYERGDNRVGIVRLQRIAAALQCDVAFFLQETPTSPGRIDSVTDAFMATPEGVIIARAFARIPDADVRRSIARFIDSLSRRSADAPALQAAE